MIYILIFFISFFTKIYKINFVPPSLFSDEVDIGYQAQIFNKCYSDYYGNFLPTHFHSFSDWRTSGYLYSTIILEKLGINSDLSIRLPAAIYGSLCVLLLILIINISTKLTIIQKITLAIVFSLNPWLYHYSRTGFEVTGMLFFILLGIFWLIKSYHKFQTKLFTMGLISLVVSTYFYSTAKFFSPALALIFIILTITKNKIKISKILLPIFIVFLFCIPQVKDIYQQKSGYRFSYISVFSDPFISKKIDFQRYLDSFPNVEKKVGYQTTLFEKILHNKITNVGQTILNNYFNSFSTSFLIIKGDENLRQGFGEYGMLLIVEYIFLFLGLYLCFKKTPSFTSKLFLVILILAPIPSSLTRDSAGPHATRLILLLPSIMYFYGNSLIYLFNKKILVTIVFILLATNSIFFYESYFVHYPSISEESWHLGLKEAVLFANNQQQANPQTINYYSSQVESFVPFFLYYTKYSPVLNSCAPALTISSQKIQNEEYLKAENNNYFGKFDWQELIKQDFGLNSHFILRNSELTNLKQGVDNYNNNYQPTSKLTTKILWKYNSPYYEGNYPLVVGLDFIPNTQ